MGILYTPEMPREDIAEIYNIIRTYIKKLEPNASGKLTFRPLRPEELNDTLTPDTRKYDSNFAAGAWTRILGATKSQKVKTGSTYMFLGVIAFEDSSKPFGFDAVYRVRANGIIKQECSLKTIASLKEHAMLLREQIVILPEDTTFDIEVKDSLDSHGVVYPIGVRIALEQQIGQQ